MRLVRRVLTWGVPLVALVLLAFILIPAEVWDEPKNDFVYTGFDPQLIYVKESGSASSPGQVQTSSDEVKITALDASRPTVHFFTTPFDKVDARMDVRVLADGEGSRPLRLGIWSPRMGAGYFIDFGGAPDTRVVARAIKDGVAGSSLQGGQIAFEQDMGSYSLDSPQHVVFNLDKTAGTASFRVTSEERPPSGHPMLRLEGSPASPAYHDIVSDSVSVQPGADYVFGGLIKLTSGRDAYKISVEWLNRSGESLGFAGDWRGTHSLRQATWNDIRLTAKAPPGAVSARIYLGSGNGTHLLFSDLFLRPATAAADANLLSNGDLLGGRSGWQFVGGAPPGSSYIEPHTSDIEAVVTDKQLPELFDSLRLTYTAVAESPGGISSVSLSNYQLTLPHQRFYGVKVDDPRVKIPFAIALEAAALLVALQAVAYMRGRAKRRPSDRRQLVVRVTRNAVWCAVAVCAYLAGNALLFGLGTHPFDMTAEKYWAYIAVTYGPAQLYYLPNLVSLADVWNGGPWHEAVFPYGGMLAHIFSGIGGLNAAFLSGPGGLQAQAFSAELSTKATIVLFGLADGVLIYQIVKASGQSQRCAALAAGAFLFNPAVWFSMSVWGQTHVISIFFALLGIWFMFRQNATGAWLSLGAAALTRPQMLVPVFLLVVVLLKIFPLRQNLRSACWMVVGVSLLLAPYTLAISPSLPIDVLYNQFHFQEAGGNEAAQTVVSLGSFSIWPVVSGFADGAAGAARFQHIASGPLIGPLSYQRTSDILSSSIVLIAAALIMLRSRKEGPGGYLLPVAMGTVGFFITRTGLAATHMLMVLPFLLVCAGRVRTPAYWSMAAVWTITTLVPMWGGLGEALADVKRLAPYLHADNNPLTWAFMHLYTLDAFVIAGVAANVCVFLWLCVELLLRPAPRQARGPTAFAGDGRC